MSVGFFLNTSVFFFQVFLRLFIRWVYTHLKADAYFRRRRCRHRCTVRVLYIHNTRVRDIKGSIFNR
jgi:hypothetical protein